MPRYVVAPSSLAPARELYVQMFDGCPSFTLGRRRNKSQVQGVAVVVQVSVEALMFMTCCVRFPSCIS